VKKFLFFGYNKKDNFWFIMNHCCDEIFDKYCEYNKNYLDRLSYIRTQTDIQYSSLGNISHLENSRNTYYNNFLQCIKIKNLKQFYRYYNDYFKDNDENMISEYQFIQNLDEYNYDNDKDKYSDDIISFIDNYIKFMKIDKDSKSYGERRKQLYNDTLTYIKNNRFDIKFFIIIINNELLEFSHIVKEIKKVSDYFTLFFLLKSLLEVYDIFKKKQGNSLFPNELNYKQIFIRGYDADKINRDSVLEEKINKIIEFIKTEVNKNINRYLLTPYTKKLSQPLQRPQPDSSQIIEREKNDLKGKIQNIIGEHTNIFIDNIDDNNKLISNIKKQYKETLENDASIIKNIDQIIEQYPEYTKINSCMNPTNPVYLIRIHTNPDTYANLSKDSIDELEKLLTEYNKLISKTVVGGSKNLRHSIDLIIKSFKKQRPSLNINPDLLYNCILSSSNKNNKKPLRKYNNQITKK
jgi:hypothetical protein